MKCLTAFCRAGPEYGERVGGNRTRNGSDEHTECEDPYLFHMRSELGARYCFADPPQAASLMPTSRMVPRKWASASR
jgi:hypothetical protein